jgi:hypothetical protein
MPIHDASGWRYEVQREQVRGESALYSVMVAPPSKAAGYLVSSEAREAIAPVVDDSDGTRASVLAVIRRHRAYLREQARKVTP